MCACRQRASEAIELAHDKCVAGAAGGGRLRQAGRVRVGPGESVIDVDALRRYAARLQTIALGGDVLGWGRRARSRPAFRHPRSPSRIPDGHRALQRRVLWDTLRRPQRWRRGVGRPPRYGFGGLRDGRYCLAWNSIAPEALLPCRRSSSDTGAERASRDDCNSSAANVAGTFAYTPPLMGGQPSRSRPGVGSLARTQRAGATTAVTRLAGRPWASARVGR